MASATASHDLRFDSGRICLDLVATVVGRLGEDPAERLGRPGQLAAWLIGAGLVPSGAELDSVDTRWLARFRELRELLHRVVHSEIGGISSTDGTGGTGGTGRGASSLDVIATERDVGRLNALAAIPPPAVRAVRARDGALVRTLVAAPDCAALLGAVARDAVELLTDPVLRGQLRQCEGENCSLVYLDTSRGRRRRWCSSEVCGNRERVARHRRRAVAAQLWKP
ncbi:CGNR zinc finger domain-containing protein [Streptomyces sp. H27-D2]|uniref:CGNR zinc finger domain-containing protein n=1 Tax=Streptomyces sp. H27-D2 TaxID=3046304 RepID=UPI002DB757DB|nr:ABATE domain-containing protein [Streptomyces sp. H27-D2]MEC4015084.1 ABATE domain-containing protein [Streptomyces sp. H27-D2]